MRTHRGHFTTTSTFIAGVIKSHGKTEMRFRKDGKWRKTLKAGGIVTGNTRSEARTLAKAQA